MKFLAFLIISVIIIPVIPITTSNAQSDSSSGLFSLQTNYGNNSLDLFTSTDPVKVVVEVNVSFQNSNLVIGYLEKIGAHSYSTKSIQLYSGEHLTKTITTNSISLGLINNDNLFTNYTANGYFRVYQDLNANLSNWTPFNLSFSTPYHMNLFSTKNRWVDNVTITLRVQEIIGGTLSMDYSLSDTGNHNEITKNGTYEYTINTSSISLWLESTNYSRAVGSYIIVDHGQVYQNQVGGFSYVLVFMIFIGISARIVYKRHRKC